MSLFISNFSFSFRIFGTFLTILLAYNIGLLYFRPYVSMMQNQEQVNYAIAENFMYEDPAEYMILGSSMAARLENIYFPDSYYNLSFAGGSVMTGLELLRLKGAIPKKLFLEINCIYRPSDDEMVDAFHNPWRNFINQWVPSFRSAYQPYNIILTCLKSIAGKDHEQLMKVDRDPKIFDVSLSVQMEDYRTAVKINTDLLRRLKSSVEHYQKLGTKVYFFEMPMANTLMNSKKATELRNQLHEEFDLTWIEFSQDREYHTGDGIHLIYRSAYELSLDFVRLNEAAP